MVSLLKPAPGVGIWEIGPGLGAMSESILKQGAHLTVFEIDPAYCEWLQESLGGGRFQLIQGDVVKTWKDQWAKTAPDKVLGNLPYNAASAIIAAFIENGCLADMNVFTVQDEMGQRMWAKPGNKNYSSFSVLCQTSAKVKDGGKLTPGSFYPAPRVNSRIVTLEPATPFGEIVAPEAFRALVRGLFASRRKTLSNNLAASGHLAQFPPLEAVREAFHAENVELSRRPETVSPGEWVAISNRIAQG
ncbi:MAG: 16S rRNA (adenine(1518)-N(6)/adenine(1519)-N(6))-dimethyltransferase RsmA [Spirochaetales bacterium]|nr:16S rRNA (adenine(1518)-N(6)/adenine(1519)-N(6))-dimethyltransferase RsmA [Spirochaetales bacterium]